MTAAVVAAGKLSSAAAIADDGGKREQQHPQKYQWSWQQDANGAVIPAWVDYNQ